MSTTHVSFLNRLKAATITASSSASGYAVSNIAEPEMHGLAWRSSVVTDSWIVIDLGSAIAVDWLGIMGANFTSFRVEQNGADSWAPPAYNSGVLTIGRDPDQRLYRRAVKSNGNFTRRFTRIFIPAQTPTDGAPYFELYAGVFAGTFTTVPRGIVVTPALRAARVTPRVTHEAALGGWTTSLPTGDTFATPRYSRLAQAGTEYDAWLAIDRQIDAAPKGIFCLITEWQGTGAVGMFRMESDHGWEDDGASWKRDAFELTEANAG